jgi:hypothetical protein
MECIIDGKVISIWIKKTYREDVDPKNGKMKILVDTEASVFDVDTTKKGKERRGVLMGHGLAIQSIKDDYKRHRGDNLAILRAIKAAGWDGNEHKAAREEFWTNYHTKYASKRLKNILGLMPEETVEEVDKVIMDFFPEGKETLSKDEFSKKIKRVLELVSLYS